VPREDIVLAIHSPYVRPHIGFAGSKTVFRTFYGTLLSMPVLNYQKDIVPLSEFRASAAEVLRHLQQDQATVILTQNGKAAAAIMGIAEYQRQQTELLELRQMVSGLADALAGKTIPHNQIQRAKP
jgi:antitoxin YefM